MKASEAREIAENNSRHKDLHFAFKEIKKAAKHGQKFTFLPDLDQEQAIILRDEYGYKIVFTEDDVWKISW
jgi:hypothetical protein